jgi:hypothetical protein
VREPREYEIYKHAGMSGMYQNHTGLVLIALTKKAAIKIAREQLGPGTYEAKESTPEQRAAQKRVCDEVRELLKQHARV